MFGVLYKNIPENYVLKMKNGKLSEIRYPVRLIT